MAKKRYKVHLSASALVHADRVVWAECPQDAEATAEQLAEQGLVKFTIADVTDNIKGICEDNELDGK